MAFYWILPQSILGWLLRIEIELSEAARRVTKMERARRRGRERKTKLQTHSAVPLPHCKLLLLCIIYNQSIIKLSENVFFLSILMSGARFAKVFFSLRRGDYHCFYLFFDFFYFFDLFFLLLCLYLCQGKTVAFGDAVWEGFGVKLSGTMA